jgi:phosphate/sulfate permease/DNA-binding CsgD family transcriptional regulator
MFFLSLTSGLFLGWTLGANDAANVFGSAVGSKMIKFKQAAIIASVFVIIGAVVQGAGASHTLGKLGSISAIGGAFSVAFASGLTVFYMTKLGLPVSSTQAIVGAIIGWNLYTGQPTDTHALTTIVMTWISGPILGGLFAVVLYIMLRAYLKRVKLHILKLDTYLRNGLIIAGAFGSYSLGANNIANVVGVFVPSAPGIVLNFGLISIDGVQLLFLLGGLAIAAGIITYSKKVMMTVGDDLMKLSAESSLVVVLAHSLVLFVFSSSQLSDLLFTMGLPRIPMVPVSSSQAIVGSIIGIGLLKGGNNIKYNVLGSISLAWIMTPILAVLTSLVTLFTVERLFRIEVYRPTEWIQKMTHQAANTPIHAPSIDLYQPALWSIILILLIIIVYLLWNNRKLNLIKNVDSKNEREQYYQYQKSELQREIELKTQNNQILEQENRIQKQELMNLALGIVQKNEFLETLQTKIARLQTKDSGRVGLDDLSKLSNSIIENLNLDKERQMFNLIVSEQYADFFSKLDQNYHGLTENEKRLSAMIRLKLSSKDISSLMNISPKSVEVNRYRLRKKMNIPHNQRLTEVISKL